MIQEQQRLHRSLSNNNLNNFDSEHDLSLGSRTRPIKEGVLSDTFPDTSLDANGAYMMVDEGHCYANGLNAGKPFEHWVRPFGLISLHIYKDPGPPAKWFLSRSVRNMTMPMYEENYIPVADAEGAMTIRGPIAGLTTGEERAIGEYKHGIISQTSTDATGSLPPAGSLETDVWDHAGNYKSVGWPTSSPRWLSRVNLGYVEEKDRRREEQTRDMLCAVCDVLCCYVCCVPRVRRREREEGGTNTRYALCGVRCAVCDVRCCYVCCVW